MNARIVTATNQDLAHNIVDGKFRQDLFYRLSVFTIKIPPLRERKADIPLLVESFRQAFNEELGKNIAWISESVMQHLKSYSWHGNIRELKNSIQAAMILCHDESLEPKHLPAEFLQIAGKDKTLTIQTDILKDSKYSSLIDKLESNHWNVSKTARLLKVSRTYIYQKLRELNIEIPR